MNYPKALINKRIEERYNRNNKSNRDDEGIYILDGNSRPPDPITGSVFSRNPTLFLHFWRFSPVFRNNSGKRKTLET